MLKEYVKEKTNKLIDAFFKLCEESSKDKGKHVEDCPKYRELDIDDEYKLRVKWVLHSWEIIYKESGAIISETKELGVYALTELIGSFTESICEDYWMNET